MVTTWFISDTHFGHENILRFEPHYRPFQTIEEHDFKLIENWNKVVKPNDIVYHLGDVLFGQKNWYKLGHLNGDKRLIMGNHDCYASSEYLKYFTKVYGCLKYQGFIILSHIPVHPNQLENRFRYNIHGHLHSKKINDSRYINLSCEYTNLTPISWEQLKEQYMDE